MNSWIFTFGMIALSFSLGLIVGWLRSYGRSSLQVNKLASLGQLSAGVAHEINNPLTVIMTSIDLIESEVARKDVQKTQEKLDRMKRAAARVAKIVTGMKRYSRQTQSEFRSVSLSPWIEELSVLFELQTKASSVKVLLDLKSQAVVSVDDSCLEQVLVNLVGNSVESLKQLNAERWIKVETTDVGHEAVIRVWDSGPGVPPEKVRFLFSPFFTTKRSQGGTGLGLHISQSIVKSFGGELLYLGRVPHPCFEVRLPMLRAEQKLQQAA